ncbi:putative methyltransferase type 12 [Magnetofaba australis IT-1]|uniref:Putative methyltransferase type 12 n=1 Tax=Magnetofaba australis IT-1 TaxID=1434232 RepID=A0A1Y2K000_9PROT|nr:putative methyltransferase type 12 [Magnetofaba australis IT-1]
MAYARAQATAQNQPIDYVCADYLHDPLPQGFDLITLIYFDLCPLSPSQRATLLQRMRAMLNPGGRIVLDVLGPGALTQRREGCVMESRLMNGFWAPGDYVGIQQTFVYAEERVTLDRYVIVEPEQRWEVFNWLYYFIPASLTRELADAGFVVEEMMGGLNGDPLSDHGAEIGVIARCA